jgi:APA family basic amino acid/polyamine antiporter
MDGVFGFEYRSGELALRWGRDMVEQIQGDKFTRSLGIFQVTASGVAVIIGAGIFVLMGAATERAGALVWLSFVIAAALSALTAFSYMELSSMFPRASAEHEFTRQVFPRWIAGTVGWVMAVALVVATATVALGFSQYLREFVSIDRRLGAIALVLVMVVISYLGMERAAWVVVGLGAVEVGSLVVVGTSGLSRVGDVNLTSGQLGGVLSGAALVFFAFIGFDEVITLSEETKDPVRTIPRALFLALGISTLLYVLVAVSAVSVLGVDGLTSSERPLADVMTELSAAAIVSTSSTVLLVVTAASRMLYGVAVAGDLPGRLGVVRHRRVPLNALLVSAIVACGLILFNDLSLLAAATDVLVYVTFVFVNVVTIVLRKTQPDLERPFRIRGAIGWVPVVPVLGLVVVIVVSGQLELRATLLAALLIVAGAVVHWMHRLVEFRKSSIPQKS